ncbi:MAG TPA: 2'-5' RNA ligase family protein [Actinomycetes bacterium]|jgi:2'-5' RNA ligase|nr:2'-5' RNA ligase family protein [Actinomycetes bacterium]
MGTRNIGVAVAVPPPYGAQLQAWREQLGDPTAHAIPAHITLLPPTRVAEGELIKIDAHLQEVAAGEAGPFPLVLRGTGTFRPISPVVFVQIAIGIADCERLESRVRSGPLSRELRFPYHPHVTIAHDVPEDVLDRAFGALSGYHVRFEVAEFSLYEHGPDGVWRPERNYRLGQAAAPQAGA